MTKTPAVEASKIRRPKIGEVLTDDVKGIVSAWLLAKAFAQTVRERVDQIERAVLQVIPLHVARDMGDDAGERITDPKFVYLSDQTLWPDYHAEVSRRERADGIKPPAMPEEFCPALVAEDALIKIEWLLMDEAGKPFGLDSEMLCRDLDHKKQFIDLTVKMVVNSPGFVPPALSR